MEENKELFDLIEKLKEAVEDGDNEYAHAVYDDILYLIANKYDKETVELIEKIKGEMSFWYA